MFDKTHTMLPKTATDLAKAMDVLEERLFQLPVDAITKDPAKVPETLLDHLAWENSVDVWDVDWPVSVKRRVIKLSAEVHRFKGTPWGIRQALSAFGVDIELVEWWQPGGSGIAGTFWVRAFVTDTLDDGEDFGPTSAVIAAIQSTLDRVSPVSRAWSLHLGIRAETPIYNGVFCNSHLFANAPPKEQSVPALVVGANAVASAVVAIHASAGATK